MCFLLAGIVILVLILLLILILIPLPHLHVFLILILRLLLLRSKKACFATLSRWDPGCAPVLFLFENEAQAQCSSERANIYCKAHTTLYASM